MGALGRVKAKKLTVEARCSERSLILLSGASQPPSRTHRADSAAGPGNQRVLAVELEGCKTHTVCRIPPMSSGQIAVEISNAEILV